MKLGNSSDVVYKEVVIIGNGPSGIALSYMLSGNLPYVVSDSHPDEMLSMRLGPAVNHCLAKLDLEHLASGLEGRSTNPVSLLLDSLLHPYADIGIEMEPLVEFRKAGVEIDHVVLGKGPPGGSWHQMDPYVLTLSLGSWMALPGLPFHSRDSGEKRAFASNVANYYVQYVREMELSNYFVNGAVVTGVRPKNSTVIPSSEHQATTTLIAEDITEEIEEENPEKMQSYKQPMDIVTQDPVKFCMLSNAFYHLVVRGNRRFKLGRCKRARDQDASRKHRSSITSSSSDPTPQPKPIIRRDRSSSLSLSCDSINSCDSSNVTLRNSLSFDVAAASAGGHNGLPHSSAAAASNSVGGSCSPSRVPFKINPNAVDCDADKQSNWVVHSHNAESGETTTYYCKYLVMANGASDMPNRLEFARLRNKPDPDCLFHDLRSLEYRLDRYLEETREEDVEPVLIVGAGLSAADAVIAIRGRNVPVAHVFRNKSADLNRQLPENMYPEYHKVHQMMQDGGSTYPYYSAYPEYNISDIDDANRSVVLTHSKSGEILKMHVSFVAILIGSRPDLNFLPAGTNLGVRKDQPIDCKTNTVDINKLTHAVNGCDNLFAIGPPAGDNFVRFIPGGALAVVSELYKRNNYLCYC